MTPLPRDKVHDATVQLRRGKSVRNVPASRGISPSTVAALRNNDKGNIPAPKIGRPSKISNAAKVSLARQFDTSKTQSLRNGRRSVKSADGPHVHVRSVRRFIYEEALKALVSPKKPSLTNDQRAARREFARNHLSWTIEHWKKVIFSDDTVFSRMGSYGRKYHYKRPVHKCQEVQQIQQTKQAGGDKLMM